jgi:hypothetical protein
LAVENRQSEIQNPQLHLARLYLCAAGAQKLTVNASSSPATTPARGLRQYIAEALHAALSERAKPPSH